jgi:hypothetical protein
LGLSLWLAARVLADRLVNELLLIIACLDQGAATVGNTIAWSGNWAWSLPLIVATVIFHIVCITLIHDRIARENRRSLLMVALVMGRTTLSATFLHASEAGLWALVYRMLGALPDRRSAMLYSLGAMTTYGHEAFDLANHWRLMGTLEALNGMILFGLTTAFLYATFQKLRPIAGASLDQRRT